MVGPNAPDRANWAVLWISPKTKKVTRKEFEHDHQGAVDFYIKVKGLGAKGATLLCKNFGFAPPTDLQPHEVTIKKKRYLKTPLKQMNAEGIWWCPYCQKLRRFKKTHSFKVDGITVRETRHVCPMCGISHRDHQVRKWNPIAQRLFYELEEAPRRRAPRTKSTRQRDFRRKRRRKKSDD